ncbi:LuxR C-terminal-related transcriptional regulator [Agreia sp. PsM10]|uniref:helix-turn-helix transcriptional regulator n=1 Tax=Agreia sp. PsM10 TaxID=3030533 RepID=UPI00263A7019|nr:LuxR C-terminal-related transcriptional regulator [Agreia sp. PsM10]MDN4639066.1 LuxR C-terminal-related transcriptional regulator [Agreia sp. PsM10]
MPDPDVNDTALDDAPLDDTAFDDTVSAASRRWRAEQARLSAEQTDKHAVALESVLAVLRSTRLDDRASRAMAIDVAASALVGLRTASDERSSVQLEPVVGAFARLRSDLRPLVRFGDLDVQFVEPPSTGRALPGEIAHAARAIVRSAVLALVDEGESRKVRIQWDCDGLNLLIGIRDDGAGELTPHDDSLRPIAERVTALNGGFDVTATPGWGSSVAITLPLDPPAVPEPLADVVSLSPREREVLKLVASGAQNRAIAEQLGVSANTVKFHVSNVLRKAGVRTRGELAVLSRPGA